MKSSLWFEASMLALVLLISVTSVALKEYASRHSSAPTHVASWSGSGR